MKPMFALLAAASLTTTTALLLAGPLNPPAGQVAPTFKTLTEVEPRVTINAANTPGDADSMFRITVPGSYYLAGNIQGASGKSGIKIAVGNVSLDLNGFALLGSLGTLDGITVSGSGRPDIAVGGGSIRGWGGDGLDLANTLGSRVADLRVSANAQVGIRVGVNAVVHGCTSTENDGTGIAAAGLAIIESCTARRNGGDGIAIEERSLASRCLSYANDNQGITAAEGSSILDCNVGSNVLTGVVVSKDCLVRGNICDSNGSGNGQGSYGAGIYVNGGGNRIESNVCNDNYWGVVALLGGNFIVRNSCAGNSAFNWYIGDGNVCYVVNAAKVGANFTGNSGGVPPGSEDPSANFTY